MEERPLVDKLLPGERVVWSGRPSTGVLLTGRDAFLIPFSFAWCGFAIFWTVMATSVGGPSFMTLWGLMFVCVGLFVSIGRFFVDAWLRSRTAYALTDRRILIVRSGRFKSLLAMSLVQLPEAQLSEGGNGRGTVKFGQSRTIFGSVSGSASFSAWIPSLDPTPQFLNIEDSRRVFDLVQRSTSEIRAR